MKNISDLHLKTQEVSAQSIFKGQGSATSIQMLENATLKEHVSKTNALLICLSGEVVYQDETGMSSTLKTGNFIDIPANIKHLLTASKFSQLILIK